MARSPQRRNPKGSNQVKEPRVEITRLKMMMKKMSKKRRKTMRKMKRKIYRTLTSMP